MAFAAVPWTQGLLMLLFVLFCFGNCRFSINTDCHGRNGLSGRRFSKWDLCKWQTSVGWVYGLDLKQG